MFKRHYFIMFHSPAIWVPTQNPANLIGKKQVDDKLLYPFEILKILLI